MTQTKVGNNAVSRQGSPRVENNSLGSSSGIMKSNKRPPRRNAQQQSLECLQAILRATKGTENQAGAVAKAITETLLPCMVSMQQEITELRADSSMRWETHQERLEESRKHSDDRHNATMEKLEACASLLRRGVGPSDTSQQPQSTIQKKLDAATDWLKYNIVLERIDHERGAELYESLSGTVLKPSSMILKAALWALGDSATQAEMLQFIRKKLPEDGSTGSSQKVYSALTVAHNRVLEPIREAFIRSFLFGLDETNPLHPRNEDMRTKSRLQSHRSFPDDQNNDVIETTDAQKQAVHLYQSGEFKTESTYDGCWKRAWLSATREGFATARILRTHLHTHRPEAETCALPDVPQTAEQKRAISIYALGFLRLKISKLIQKRAEDDNRGMRLSHAPLWAKEVNRIHKTLKRNNFVCDEDLPLPGTCFVMNGLAIANLLSEEERDRLEES